MKRHTLSFGLAFLVLLAMPRGSRADTVGLLAVPNGSGGYTFHNIINPGDVHFTQLLGINNDNTIAGYFGDGTMVPNNGFTLMLPNTFTPENFPGATQTQVVGINNAGETVGFYIDTAGQTHGFTFDGTSFKTVDDPMSTAVPPFTQLLGVNDSGRAAGYWTDAAGNFHPFTWVPGTFTEITTIPGQVSAQATDVNNAGDATGFNMKTPTTSDGFLDVGGTFTTLDFPGSTFTQALGLNNSGDVVGFYTDAAGINHGFVYTISTGMYASVSVPGAGSGGTVINGINDKGELVGFFGTPEPASLFLFGSGLIALTTLKLRKGRA